MVYRSITGPFRALAEADNFQERVFLLLSINRLLP